MSVLDILCVRKTAAEFADFNIIHLMTAHKGNICFVSQEFLCFFETKSRESPRFEGKNGCYPKENSLSVLLYSINKINHNY